MDPLSSSGNVKFESVLANVKADPGVTAEADTEKDTSVVSEDFSVDDGGECSEIVDFSLSRPRAPAPGA